LNYPVIKGNNIDMNNR